jgi:hypothetical protein
LLFFSLSFLSGGFVFSHLADRMKVSD